MAFGNGQLWVTTTRALVRVDPRRNAIVARIPLPPLVDAAAVDGRFVWVLTSPILKGSANPRPSLLSSVDIATGRIVGAPIKLFPMAQGQIAVAGGSLWVTNDNHGTFGRLFRIDPTTRRVTGAVHIPNDPHSVVVAGGSLWVGESDSGKVVRVDPETGTILGTPISVGGALLELAAGHGVIWVANSYSGRLATISERTSRVVTDRAVTGVDGVAVSRGAAWTFSFRTAEVATSDGARLKIRGGADGIAANGGSIWVINPLGITRVSSRP